MILNETMDLLKKVYGRKLRHITIDRLVVGVFFTGIKLSNGTGGISYTPVEEIHRSGCCGHTALSAFERSPYVSLKQASISDILNHAIRTPLLDTIRLVAINALSTPLLSEARYKLIDGDPLDLINFRSAKRIAMVGAIRPFLNRLKGLKGIELGVIEKKKESLNREEMAFYVPSEHASEALSMCDLALITGASIANGTIDELLNTVKADAMIVVAGPTASFLPEALFNKGVNIVSGAIVTDPDRALDMIGEGAGAYHLFEACLRKINLLRESYKTFP